MTELLEAAQTYFANAFDGIIRIETDEGGTMWVDGRAQPPVVMESAPRGVDGAYCLWQAKQETLARVFSPEARRLEAAYISGRLSISGDMAVMARLGAASAVASTAESSAE
jgi:hypothetical protein